MQYWLKKFLSVILATGELINKMWIQGMSFKWNTKGLENMFPGRRDGGALHCP